MTRTVLKLGTVAVLAVLGTVAKSVGWILYGSITLMVDAFTCTANLVALGAAIYYSQYTSKGPDEKHPYGHLRLSLAGSFIVILTYSFIAGVSTMELIHHRPGQGLMRGALYSAVAGLIFYSPLPYILRKMEDPLQVYGLFTISEILESLVAIAMISLSLASSPIFDYIGGLIILGFIFYEILENAGKYIRLTSDTAPSSRLIESIIKEIEDALKVEVASLRIREVYPGRYQGDIVVRVPEKYSIVEAHDLADKIEEIGCKYYSQLTVHVEPRGEKCGR
ncbi:MAG: cation transporter [Desulfurococcales archaeon]|nr:cation transporter [Desulfurococcales archaeon]